MLSKIDVRVSSHVAQTAVILACALLHPFSLRLKVEVDVNCRAIAFTDIFDGTLDYVRGGL